MFTNIETKILISIFLTSVIMLLTAQVWGGGGLITTAFAVYAITGAVIYAVLTFAYFLAMRLKSGWQARQARATEQNASG
jgi:hypothetical protein